MYDFHTNIYFKFNNSKYTHWYLSLIDKALSLNRRKYQGVYFEEHHIMPSSLGGPDVPSNKVLLTAREHYVCHAILLKMCKSQADLIAMSFAFYKYFGVNNDYKSKLYDIHKNATSIRGYTPHENTYKDRIWVNKDGIKKKIKKCQLDDFISDGWSRGTGTHSAYHCQRIKEGRAAMSDQSKKEMYEKISNGNKQFIAKMRIENPEYLKRGGIALKKKLEDPQYKEEFSNKLKANHKPSLWTGKKREGFTFTHTQEAKLKISKSTKGNKSTRGMVWITNGIESKMIMKDTIMPEGWSLGMKKKKNLI